MRSIKEMDKRLDEREQEIERLNNLLKETGQTLSEQTTKAITLKSENERLHSIIKEVREYIENNSLYEQDYDYDYEENLTEYPPSDEQARKDILSILDKEK